MFTRTIYLLLLSILLLSCNGGGSKKEYTYYQEQGEIFHTGFHISRGLTACSLPELT